MKISLRDIITERVTYHPPRIDVLAANRGGGTNASAAKRLFYDFYAMEYLHRMLGTPLPTSIERKVHASKQDPNFGAGFAAGANWEDTELPTMGAKIAPHKMRQVIDDVFEQVTKTIGQKLSSYLRLVLVQELRHIISKSNEVYNMKFQLYNLSKSKTAVTNDDFKKLVADYMPSMIGEEESAKRILRWSVEYKKKDVGYEMPDFKTSDPEPEIEEPQEPVQEPEPEKQEEPEDPEFNNGLSGDDWETHDPFWDPESTNENILNEDDDDDDEHQYQSGQLTPKVVGRINRAKNKVGLTWHDIDNAYNKIKWNTTSFGGPKWGAGVKAFLKLIPALNSHDYERVASAVDHIFDLAHNSGPMLNKGGLFVTNKELDIRARITHVARYMDRVSPVIKQLIVRCLRYLPGNPEDELNVDTYLDSERIMATPEQKEVLDALHFDIKDGSYRYTATLPFVNKQGSRSDIRYEFTIHANNIFTLKDIGMSDVHVFHSFDEAADYIKKHLSGNFKEIDKYHQYDETRVGLKTLPANALKLLDLNMQYTQYGSYYVGSNEILGNTHSAILKAYSDGTYLTRLDGDNKTIKIYSNFEEAYETCKVYSEQYKFYLNAYVKSTAEEALNNIINPPPVAPTQATTQYGNTYTSNKQEIALPPFSNSPTDYSVHIGLSSPPKIIRLTGHDENIMNGSGFAPKMVGNKLVYIQSNTGDSAIFYNNNKATVIMKSIQGAKIMKTIPEMLQYLHDNWDVAGFKGTSSASGTGTTSVNLGVKVSPIIEKQLNAQMFHWSPELSAYVSNASGDIIKINGANKSSTVSFYKGAKQKQFPDLASLLKYINGGGYTMDLKQHEQEWADQQLAQAA